MGAEAGIFFTVTHSVKILPQRKVTRSITSKEMSPHGKLYDIYYLLFTWSLLPFDSLQRLLLSERECIRTSAFVYISAAGTTVGAAVINQHLTNQIREWKSAMVYSQNIHMLYSQNSATGSIIKVKDGHTS